ncbi:MAG: LysE family translocator [Akkermansia sp.]|nr:LysE family translocator [Akkermansia sp.]
MMTEAVWSLVVVCGLLVLSQLSPGPDVFFVFRTALAQGFRRGVAVGAGISLGFFIQAVVACTAGAWVMAQSWSVYMLWAAAAWLIYLAYKIFPWRRGEEVELSDGAQGRQRCLVLLGQGFLCNILNPKCMLFILTLSAGPLRAHAGLAWYAPVLMVALTFAGLLGWCLWSALLQWGPVRGCYARHTNGIDAVFALLLFVFALLLL